MLRIKAKKLKGKAIQLILTFNLHLFGVQSPLTPATGCFQITQLKRMKWMMINTQFLMGLNTF